MIVPVKIVIHTSVNVKYRKKIYSTTGFNWKIEKIVFSLGL
jgi:hypothetical protein